MAENKDPHDLHEAARGSLELAEVLVGKKHISDQDFLERMARTGSMVDEDPETCGIACRMLIDAQVAQEMLEAGEYEDVRNKWVTESWRRWQDSKFFKLWQEEQAAGRDPHKAFQERGWEP
jgi:hypothetical protein